MRSPAYLDCNATAPIRPEAAEAAAQALACGGNPSSVHAAGRAARAILERAREQVAALAGVAPAGLVFTSGGTEANALAIDSAVRAGARRLIVSAVEHDSVLEAARLSGAAVDLLPVDRDGRADLAWLARRLARWDQEEGRPFVALMAANNETGVIQPVREAGDIVRSADGWLHVDAVQAAGKLALDVSALNADTLSLSAHKLGGPQGIGALAAGPRATLSRRQHGGGQERGRRAGTENLSGAAGFGAAAEAAARDLARMAAQAAWRDAAAARMVAVGGYAVGAGVLRLSNTLCIAVKGLSAELQVMGLDLGGVMVSAGAACSSGKVKPSHVLTAMGLEDLAGCAIRASGGWSTTEEDWNRLADVWLELHARHAARRREPA